MPATGQMADQIAKALQALLNERHLPGRVDYLRQAKQEGGDLIGVVYRVEEITIRIRTVEFPGASPEQAAFLAYGARKLADAEYSRSLLATVAHDNLLPPFLERGYLKAAFGPAEARVVPPSSEQAGDKANDEIEVDAIVPLTPGKQYSVSDFSWKGNSALSTGELTPLIHLPVGQLADAVRLVSDIDTAIKLYRNRGYMAVQMNPDAQMDDDKSTVRYVVKVAEGDLYRMGELEFLGIDTPSKDRLYAAWTLREGQPYNAGYTRKFLENAPALLPKGLRYSVKLNEELDEKNKTVDVTIHFKME